MFISIGVCPSCVIPQSSTLLWLVCSMCVASSSCSNKTHTPPLSLLRPPFASFNFFLYLSLCFSLSLHLPPFHCLNCFVLPVFLVSHLLSYFLTLYTLILVSFTSSLCCPPPSLPPNQSHMLEREAERAEDGQDCVVCRVW